MSRRGRGLAGWVFGSLLKLYPPAFRERFEEGMRHALMRELEHARGEGPFAVVWFWARSGLSLVWHGVAERRAGVGEGAQGVSMGGGRAMDRTLGEMRQAVRRLLRRPGFSLAAGLTLAVGLGGTTAVYGVVYAVILKPLPYDQGDRLVMIGHESPTDRLGMNTAAYLHYRERASTLQELGLWIEQSSPVAGTGEPLELKMIHASATLLPMLRVEPVLGRGFTEEDHRPGADPVALVTHGFWVRHLGADVDAVGRRVFPGSDRRVVGVLPEGFEFVRPEALVVFGNRFEAPDLFVPLEDLDPAQARFGNFIYHSMGRLAENHGVAEARREVAALMYEAAQAYPGGFTASELEESRYRPTLESLEREVVGDVADVLWILFGAVGFVFLIAVSNVTNLFLVRADSRSGEMAIRRALGASGRSLAVASFSEAGLLAATGGLAGGALAHFGTGVLIDLAPGRVPRLEGVGIEPPVLLFSLAMTAFTALTLGAVLVLRGRSRDPGGALAQAAGERTTRREGLRDGLVVTQVALALVLLVGSGLLTQTFRNLRDVDPGFDPRNALTLRLSLSGSILSAAGIHDGPGDARRSRFLLDVTQRLQDIPGVEAVGFSADLPLDGDEWHDHVAAEDRWPGGHSPDLKAQRVFVGSGYMKAIGAAILRGRELEPADFQQQPRVAVVNETFAEQRWPGLDPLGRRIAQYMDDLDPGGDIWYTVVGVVEDVREASLVHPAAPTVYLPTVFLPEGGFTMWVSNMVVVVRTSGDPLTVAPRVRDEILAYRPDVPIHDVATLESVASRSFGEVAFAMTLVMIAAVAALLLGIVGVHGTVSYLVGRQTREFGIRIALGASTGEVLRGVLRRTGVRGLLGISLGLVGSALTGRVLESRLFGVSPVEPTVHGGVALLLLGVVLVAAFAPARRAAAVDPVQTMKAE